jgi:hypothetical protein
VTNRSGVGRIALLAGDPADVAGSLPETDLELAAAPALACGLILDRGSGWNRRQGVTSAGAGGVAVAADTLVARAAGDRNVLTEGDGAPVGAGLETGLVGLAVAASIDAGAAHGGAIGKSCGGPQGQGSREQDEASRRKKSKKKSARGPRFNALHWQCAMIAGRGSPVARGFKVKMTASLPLPRHSLHLRRPLTTRASSAPQGTSR